MGTSSNLSPRSSPEDSMASRVGQQNMSTWRLLRPPREVCGEKRKDSKEDPPPRNQGQSFGTRHQPYTRSSIHGCERIRFIGITNVNSLSMSMSSPLTFHEQFIENHKDPVRNWVTKIVQDFGPDCGLAGFVIDMFCTAMIDVANEFDVPTYMFFTSGFSSGAYVPFPGAERLSKSRRDCDGGSSLFLDYAKRFRETKGIVVNTFLELESHSMKSLSEDGNIPPVYSVGPILHPDDENDRNPKFQTPVEYDNLEEVLPEGFLERNAGIGKVIGWAPQIDILSHRAVGGFVSHCGWNSTLESMWYGVPMAVWPLSAEQQMNAFLLVKDLGVAVEIKMDYQRNLMGGSNMFVTAEEIENGIRRLMQSQSEIRVNVAAMKLKSRMALVENGSSFDFVGRFIENVMNNMS
ncbi:UNVERIFIED_CONTAM: UDP-glycosyltransferase 71E1 [Sesamum calycinum]|uniref:Glycosyltransferase n=1 Tax=Sesamum calycinum TaxID=2727403 RepID=A0AAW2Q333_9LAMI